MFRALLKTRFAALLSSMTPRGKDGKRRGKGMIVLMCVLYAYIGVVFIGMFLSLFFAVSMAVKGSDSEWIYFALALLFSFALSFIGSIFMTKVQLFEAKDNELLLSMPIPPMYILASRAVYLYIVALVYVLIVMLPATVVGVLSGLIGIVPALLMVLGTLLLPLLVLALSSVFAWLLALITAKSGKKNLVTTVLSLVFFVGYFILISNSNKYIEQLFENLSGIADAFRFPLSPLYAFGAGLADGNILQYLIFLAWCIVPFAAAALVISKSFIRIATMRASASRARYRERTVKHKTQLSALIGKELRRFFSCSAYLLNCGIGNILLIIAAVALLIKGGSLFSAFAGDGEALDTGAILSVVAAVMPVIPLFCTSMNAVSAPSISLEGKSIWILQSMPVKGSDVLKAKALTHVIINLPGVIIFSVCAGIALKLGVANTAGMLVLNVAATFFYAFFGIALNLKYHSFDWVNENYPIKQGASVTITVLSGMGISILYFIPSIILGIAGVPSYAINLIWSVPFALAAWLICRWVLKKGGRKFETLS